MRFGKRLKWLGNFRNHFRHRKFDHLQRFLRFFNFCKINEVVRQPCQSLNLLLDIVQRIVLSKIHSQNVYIGVDDGKRRSDLVPCVGDKAFLLFISLRNRTNESPCKKADQNSGYHIAEQRNADAGHGKITVKGKFSTTVKKSNSRSGFLSRANISEITNKSAFAVVLHDLRGILNGSCIINGKNGARFGRSHLPVFIDKDREETAFKRDLR